MSNIFAPDPQLEHSDVNRQDTMQQSSPQRKRTPVSASIPNYKISPSGFTDHIVAYLIGAAMGFGVLFVFYQIIPLSIVGGAIFGFIYVVVSSQRAITKRISNLRTQFFDLLEAMSVAMRAGNPVLKALENAREDLSLMYSDGTDIMVELDIIIQKFNNAVPLSESFMDLAERSGLEDITSFASIYATIEGKSSRADEIIRNIQQIIADKMEIEMEIDTMMTAAKGEVNIMLFMPLVILGILGYVGEGFMDAIYTTAVGRIVSTVGLIVFIACFIMARMFARIKV